ncbi:PfkB family carbohydrate kinase [Polymorphospora rubra]|uniref:Bifunctional protein HldE n=1 Tax=Polymorphospora rubra TaxID=338584 RepID=A0A810N369_9ACTN|nr:bifunctional protein HldE [Polymorphospora rubra]
MTHRLVVVGDTLLDRDVDGMVTRLCPDVPVPVLEEATTLDRPGGAGLAALFAARQGFDVALVTALADDDGGARLRELLADAGIEVHVLPLPGATAEKIRLRARGQVLLRLDRGGAAGRPGEPPPAARAALAGAAAILVSDYGRGVAAAPAVRAALARTSAPVVWDPHPRGPRAAPGVRLVTPNENEVRQLTGDGPDGSRLATASRGAQELRRRWRAGAVAVTMGGDGALLCHSGPTPLVVPAPANADGDTCGAGDLFAATATGALAQGALVSEAVQEAVREATEYVAAGGVGAALVPGPGSGAAVKAAYRRPTGTGVYGDRPAGAGPRHTGDDGAGAPPHRPDGADGHSVAAGALVADVRARGGTVVATGGCFDLLHAGHVATLQAARRLGDCLVVCLNSDASVAGLKGPERPVVPQGDRSRLLAALGCVDAVVIFDEATPHAVLSWLRPDVWVKGGDYAGGGGDEPDLPEAALVRRWGGQTVVVPYLDGRSTTGMIAAARSGAGRPAEEAR